MKAMFPGSFDPMTLGHLDVVKRAAAIFDEVVVAVFYNPSKKNTFTADERVQMIKKAIHDIPNASVMAFSCGQLEGARQIGAKVVIRGIRTVSDFEYEAPWAQINRREAEDIEYVFLMSDPALSVASSSAVKEIAMFDYDLSPYVPKVIIPDIQNAVRRQK